MDSDRSNIYYLSGQIVNGILSNPEMVNTIKTSANISNITFEEYLGAYTQLLLKKIIDVIENE